MKSKLKKYILLSSIMIGTTIGSLSIINGVVNNNVIGNDDNFHVKPTTQTGQDFVFQIVSDTFSNINTATFKFYASRSDGTPIDKNDINSILAWQIVIYDRAGNQKEILPININNVSEQADGNRLLIDTQDIHFGSGYSPGDELDAKLQWTEVGVGLESGPFLSDGYSFTIPKTVIPNISISAGYQGVHQGTADLVVKYDSSLDIKNEDEHFLFDVLNANVSIDGGPNKKYDLLEIVDEGTNDNLDVVWDTANHKYTYTGKFNNLKSNTLNEVAIDIEAQYSRENLSTGETTTTSGQINTRDLYESPILSYNGQTLVTDSNGIELSDWTSMDLDFDLNSSIMWPNDDYGFGNEFELNYENNIEEIKITNFNGKTGNDYVISNGVTDWGAIPTYRINDLKPETTYKFDAEAKLKSNAAVSSEQLSLEDETLSTRDKSEAPEIVEESFETKQTNNTVNKHETIFKFGYEDMDGLGYESVGADHIKNYNWKLVDANGTTVNSESGIKAKDTGNTIKINNLKANTAYTLEINSEVDEVVNNPKIFTKDFITNKNEAIADSDFVITPEQPKVDELNNNYSQIIKVDLGEDYKNISKVELVNNTNKNVLDETENLIETVNLTAKDLIPGETYDFVVRLTVNPDTEQPAVNPKSVGDTTLDKLNSPEITNVGITNVSYDSFKLNIGFNNSNNIKRASYSIIDVTDGNSVIYTDIIDSSIYENNELYTTYTESFDGTLLKQRNQYKAIVNIEALDIAEPPNEPTKESDSVWTLAKQSEISNFNVVAIDNTSTINYDLSYIDNVHDIIYSFTSVDENGIEKTNIFETNDIDNEHINKTLRSEKGTEIIKITVTVNIYDKYITVEDENFTVNRISTKTWNK